MKTLFVTAGPLEWGSSRMRAFWPAAHMPGAEARTWAEMVDQEIPLEFDAYVFQKLANPELNRYLLEAGKQVWWDVCDPAWWFQPEACRAVAETVSGVAASSSALAEDYRAWSGKLAAVVPDRLDLSHFPLARSHSPQSPVRLIWFGLAVNRCALFAALANLERLAANGCAVELTICDDQPEHPWGELGIPTRYERWTLARENEIIAGHDIALLPPYPGPWGKVKSNNKRLTAWACGLPVVGGEDYDTLRALVGDAEQRQAAADWGMKTLLRDYTAERSARQWEVLLCP